MLTQNQQNTNDYAWHYLVGTSQQFALVAPCNIILYTGTRGPGKCLPVETLVPTINGWRKHGELRVNDTVFGSNGQPIVVTDVFEKQVRPCYRLEFNDGTSIECSDNHLWQVTIDRGFPKEWRVVNTVAIKDRIDKGYPCRLPMRPVIQYLHKELSIDPYMLGAWIGDGSIYTRVRQPTGSRTKERNNYVVEFGSNDAQLVAYAVLCNFSIKREKNGFTWLVGKIKHKHALFALGLFNVKGETKFIPNEILFNSVETRLAFLQGLCDTDGTTRLGTGARISTVSQRLADDICTLVRSLGGTARIGIYTPKEQHRQKAIIYNVDFSLRDFVPFRLDRKIAQYKQPERLGWFCPSVISVKYIGDKEVSCITVAANDNLYVAGEHYIVTHNTDTQLMRFRQRVGKGYGAHWRGIILDREYKNLDDLVAKSKRWFPAFDDGAHWYSSAKDYKWVWPSGEELLFRAMNKSDDYLDYHGHEYPFIGWNELVKYPTPFLFDAMMSTNRSSFIPELHTPNHPVTRIDKDGNEFVLCDRSKGILLEDIPLEVFATTNPLGAGHNWVKRRFIDVAPYGEIVRKTYHIFNPRTKQYEDIVRKQVTIFGSYQENPFLDPMYIANLSADSDENRRRAWLQGDWDIVAGGALDDVWDRSIHVLPRFRIPASWRVDRAMDWGSTHPFSIGWFAEANGEEAILPDGSTFCPPPKSLIQIAEWYGTKDVGSNVGIKLSASDLALGIKFRDGLLLRDGWITETPRPGPADNQIRDVREVDVDTIEKKMEREGIKWLVSDKSPGSRKIGLQLVRDRLQAAKRNEEEPHLYFMSNCVGSISTIPVLPRDEKKFDDVDTDAEDHPYDMVRYRVLHQAKEYFGATLRVRFPT